MKLTIIDLVKKYVGAIIFLLIWSITAQGQLTEWSTLPAAELYYTPLPMQRYSASSGINPDEMYFEGTTNLALTFPITQRIRLGGQFMAINNRVTNQPVDRAFGGGVFAQYNFLIKERLSVYLEAGYALSNLCTCGEAEAYSVDSLNHLWQFGIGFNYQINNRFHLKAGLSNYQPFSQNPDMYNWTQPFIGLKYHFYKKYKTPYQVRFKNRERSTKHTGTVKGIFWTDDRARKWNISLSSAGIAAIQNRPLSGQTTPLAKFRQYVITPRVDYWINQAVVVGMQGSFHRYENNYDTIPNGNGFGTGLQARFYPLSFKNPAEYRAINLGKKGNWSLAPIIGIEVRATNYSWLEPENIGQQWQYFDIQPYAGAVFSYKKFNLFMSMGPTIGTGQWKKTSETNGIALIGLEYSFIK